jgi:D-serine deaminase-like pyridoxal phosphate-dependent protein
MTIISFIKKPTLLLDENKAKRNLDLLCKKLNEQDIEFRPHFKTHQSAEIGEWFSERGIVKITVSSVEMAEYFADAGWEDILIAFPVNILEMEAISNLARRSTLSLLVEELDSIIYLDKKLDSTVGLWIKVDVGAGRTGIPWGELDKIESLAQAIQASQHLKLSGLLTHAGHTYRANGREAVQQIYLESLQRLLRIKDHLQSKGLREIKISVGDTPSSSFVEKFGEIDEFRPGNFIFYDVQQYQAGVCKLEDIAVAVACPLAARHLERQEAVIYGGAIHLSKDYFHLEDGTSAYGLVLAEGPGGWDTKNVLGYVKSLSQEHGIIKFFDGKIAGLEIGDILCVLPAHSCLTVQAMRDYVTLDGEVIPTLNSK